MERLDECLKVHADMLDAQDIGSIYELQGLAELHYYLKVEHEFTPAEVEALLSFQDPLDVARWCWEENTHEHSFPICGLLDEIKAYQRFEKFSGAPQRDRRTELMKRLGQNYYEYRESTLALDKAALFDAAQEIAKMQDVYSFLMDFEFDPEGIENMLLLENPLKYMADNWPGSVSEALDYELNHMARENMDNIPDSPQYFSQKESTSVRERLQHAVQEVRERPAAKKPAHDSGAR